MPQTITLGHILLVLAAIALVWALIQLGTLMRHRGPTNRRGTPGYARARDARRYAIWGLVAAIVLALLGCCTPLAHITLS
jgi:hypothetical protein